MVRRHREAHRSFRCFRSVLSFYLSFSLCLFHSLDLPFNSPCDQISPQKHRIVALNQQTAEKWKCFFCLLSLSIFLVHFSKSTNHHASSSLKHFIRNRISGVVLQTSHIEIRVCLNWDVGRRREGFVMEYRNDIRTRPQSEQPKNDRWMSCSMLQVTVVTVPRSYWLGCALKSIRRSFHEIWTFDGFFGCLTHDKIFLWSSVGRVACLLCNKRWVSDSQTIPVGG